MVNKAKLGDLFLVTENLETVSGMAEACTNSIYQNLAHNVKGGIPTFLFDGLRTQIISVLEKALETYQDVYSDSALRMTITNRVDQLIGELRTKGYGCTSENREAALKAMEALVTEDAFYQLAEKPSPKGHRGEAVQLRLNEHIID